MLRAGLSPSSLCVLASLADEAKGGDGAKSALCEVPFVSIRGPFFVFFALL